MHIEKVGEDTFEVCLDGPPPTTHRVTLTQAVHRRLSGGRASPETLIACSFEFLLEMEDNTSILREFDLPLIGRYFPEFEADIARRLEQT
jgi:hypothetical protein